MLFFLLRAPTHHSFTFNLQYLHELKHKVSLSKTVCGIFHFRLRFVFIKVYICVSIKWIVTMLLINFMNVRNFLLKLKTLGAGLQKTVFRTAFWQYSWTVRNEKNILKMVFKTIISSIKYRLFFELKYLLADGVSIAMSIIIFTHHI